jgi:acetyl-CoA C-acetyltransferase
VDQFASDSFAKAVAAQEAGFFDGEIVPVVTEKFELEGYKARGIKLQGKVTSVDRDTHPRISPVEVLAKLKPVYEGGVQTGGNSSALVDAAAACVVTSGAYAKANGKKPAARVVAAAAVGVPPEIMGIGPAPAIRLLLERTGLQLGDIGRFEINEAQGAQTLAVGRELGLDLARLNVNGGAIALGHPLACTGVRLTITLARELRRSGLRYGISSACVGGGQGIALLIENPDAGVKPPHTEGNRHGHSRQSSPRHRRRLRPGRSHRPRTRPPGRQSGRAGREPGQRPARGQ